MWTSFEKDIDNTARVARWRPVLRKSLTIQPVWLGGERSLWLNHILFDFPTLLQIYSYNLFERQKRLDADDIVWIVPGNKHFSVVITEAGSVFSVQKSGHCHFVTAGASSVL